tara:strand:- start:25 stop:447 length:423 start_codon:yes stop_codon:yes gene_type:complete
MNDNILDKSLYEKAKKIADEKYKRHSAYKSMFIVKTYKDMGGRYKSKKQVKGSTTRWNEEQWVQVLPYLKNNKKIACGEDNKKNKVCRPLKRVNKNTPITLPELLKIHSKNELINLAEKKIKDMNGRVFWKNLKFIKSKK